MDDIQSTEWIDPKELNLPFTVKEYHEDVYARRITIRYNNGTDRKLKGFEFLLPNRKSKLLWVPWPKWIARPEIPTDSKYHAVKYFMAGRGTEVLQPRKTRCYVHSYKYSGVWHELEDSVPADLQTLLDETTVLYGAQDTERYGTPMCLANEYTTLRHCIHAHGDDEKQMGTIHDVICWVDGATRRLILRTKSDKKCVLNVELPEGLYIMRGRSFQKEYTHEIPRAMETTFTQLLKVLEEEDKDEILELEKNEIADWLAVHPKWVKEHTDKGLHTRYLKWNQMRVSYTVRFFNN